MAVDPETGEEQTLLSYAVSGLNPAWSLDGSQLAFNVVTSRGFDIDVMSSDGDDRRSVLASDASEERPRWSPDGKQLTHYSDAGGSWEVYTVLLATGTTRPLTDSPGFDGQPAWQPSTRFAAPEDAGSRLPSMKIFLYHSLDDPEVPFAHLGYYEDHLPKAMARPIAGSEHSFVEGLPTLVDDISSLSR